MPATKEAAFEDKVQAVAELLLDVQEMAAQLAKERDAGDRLPTTCKMESGLRSASDGYSPSSKRIT